MKEYFIVIREWFDGQQEPLDDWKEIKPDEIELLKSDVDERRIFYKKWRCPKDWKPRVKLLKKLESI